MARVIGPERLRCLNLAQNFWLDDLRYVIALLCLILNRISFPQMSTHAHSQALFSLESKDTQSDSAAQDRSERLLCLAFHHLVVFAMILIYN